jgi:predicted kinase
VTLARVESRRAAGIDASDATPEVVRALGARFAPWPEATELDTTRALIQTVDDAARASGPS